MEIKIRQPLGYSQTDIKSGDYLFLCCDGVLEQLTNQRLVEILSLKAPDKEKIQLLEAESTGRTRDNYTAYLIPIDKVKGKVMVESAENDVVVAVDGIEGEKKAGFFRRFLCRLGKNR